MGELDSALGGGYRLGTVTALEAAPDLGPAEVGSVVLPALANQLALGGGVIAIPPSGVAVGSWRDALLRRLPAAVVDGRLRIVDYASVDASGPWHLPIARYGRAEGMKAMLLAERAAAGSPRSPLLEVTSLDSLEAAMGSERAIRMIGQALPRTRELGGVMLALVRSGNSTASVVPGMCDAHLRLTRAASSVRVEGVRPSFLALQVPEPSGW